MGSDVTFANATRFDLVCETETALSRDYWSSYLGPCPAIGTEANPGLTNYKIYNVNRDEGITSGDTYVLNSVIKHPDTLEEVCILQVQLIGTTTYSDIAVGAKKSDGAFNTDWLSNGEVLTTSWKQDGGTYSLNYSINGGAVVTVGPAEPSFRLVFEQD